jgi:hypothetical protein
MLRQQLDMVVGKCAYPNCRLRAKVERCTPCDSIPICNTFVKLWHSKKGFKSCCNVMHEECYEHMAQLMLQRIRRHSTTIADKDIHKLMFVTSRNGKYDMIRKECQCECGGLFCVEVDEQGHPSLLGDPMTDPCSDKKKKKSSVKHDNKSISMYAWKQKFEKEDVVEEGCEQYIWEEPSVTEESDDQPSPIYEYEDDNHPDLPFTACLPPPKKKNVAAELTTTTPIQIKVTQAIDFHLMRLPADFNKLWKPSFIGVNGKNVKQLECSTQCSISIQDYYGGVRIFVRGQASNRLVCCKVAEERIRSAINAHSSS